MAEGPEIKQAGHDQNRNQDQGKDGQFEGIEDLEEIEVMVEDRPRSPLVDIQDTEEQQDKENVHGQADGDGSCKG